MPESSRAFVSFNAGEWSPKLRSRLDLEKAGSACRTLENMIVQTYGAVRRRPGTKFISSTGILSHNPHGPPGVVVTVNRHTDSNGTPIDINDCIKLATWFEVTPISLTGSGCLCGFSEFEDALHVPPIVHSTPRKKYRTKTIEGETYMYEGSTTGCPHPLDDGTGRERNTYSGTYKFASHDCAQTDDTNVHQVTSGCYGTADTNAHGEPFSTARIPAHVQSTVVKTFYGIGCSVGICALGTLPNYADPDQIATTTLSDEDTYNDALLRGIHTEGNEITGVLTSLDDTTFCFTGTSVIFIVELHALRVGCTYELVFVHHRVSGGITTSITEHVVFTADSTDPTITTELPITVTDPTTLASVLLQVL